MASGGGYDWDDDNRRIVHEGRQILERTSASLARSNQIAIETENIGTQASVCFVIYKTYTCEGFKLKLSSLSATLGLHISN